MTAWTCESRSERNQHSMLRDERAIRILHYYPEDRSSKPLSAGSINRGGEKRSFVSSSGDFRTGSQKKRALLFGQLGGSAVLSMQAAGTCSCHGLSFPAALPLRPRCFGVDFCAIPVRACIRTVVAAELPGVRGEAGLKSLPQPPHVPGATLRVQEQSFFGKPGVGVQQNSYHYPFTSPGVSRGAWARRSRDRRARGAWGSGPSGLSSPVDIRCSRTPSGPA
jgi:hypothetical protein